MLSLRRVTKEYATDAGVVHALRDVNLEVQRGEFIAVIGTSGSGKSTLMNIVGCLDRPTTGTFQLCGIDVGQRGGDGRAIVRNRMIGFIFQGFNLLARTSALENVELPLQYRGVSAKEKRKRAEAALGAVGLADRMHHTSNQLSGGQQQRVAIARALVSDPPLLLADEPTGNLDSRTSYEVLALLQDLNRNLGITVILVTHEADIARCAKRIVTFRDGRIERDEPNASLDAHALLAELGTEVVPVEKGTRERIGQAGSRPIDLPWSLPLRSALTFGAGALVGVLYDAIVLGSVGPKIPMVLGLICDAYFTTRSLVHARRKVPSLDPWMQASLAGTASLSLVLGLLAFSSRSAEKFVLSLVGGGEWVKVPLPLAFLLLLVLSWSMRVALVLPHRTGAPRRAG